MYTSTGNPILTAYRANGGNIRGWVHALNAARLSTGRRTLFMDATDEQVQEAYVTLSALAQHEPIGA